MKNLLKRIIPNFVFGWYHFCWAFLGAVIYCFPSKKIKVIGVTGTNGKSTAVFLIGSILEKAGYKVASVSSIQFKIKNKIWDNNLKMTMPGRIKIQRFLRQAVNSGCEYAVLEITSEGIKQHRHQFIDFNTAILTNLTKEHIESHNGFDNYKKAKAKLFQSLKGKGNIIVNADDPNADYFLQFLSDIKYAYGIDFKKKVNAQKLIQAEDCRFSQNGISFKVKNTQFNLNLLGKFNVYNALVGIVVGLSENIALKTIKLVLENAQGIPGRFEIVVKEPFKVIVDYAHTPDALEKVYQTIKQNFSGRIIGVLGSAGGGRDKWKRNEMGKIAEKYLDKIIITNEDPYDENPQTIINDVAKGIKQNKLEKILDRGQAIARALKLAKANDVVIITGKGCEPWMCVKAGKKIPWDDRSVVIEELKKLH
ncbi:MAG: UDP-N-acetylmuramoyl-L-alanyl-D-glutamate--2,6-diaminopimelate ligase [bacterium]